MDSDRVVGGVTFGYFAKTLMAIAGHRQQRYDELAKGAQDTLAARTIWTCDSNMNSLMKVTCKWDT